MIIPGAPVKRFMITFNLDGRKALISSGSRSMEVLNICKEVLDDQLRVVYSVPIPGCRRNANARIDSQARAGAFGVRQVAIVRSAEANKKYGQLP